MRSTFLLLLLLFFALPGYMSPIGPKTIRANLSKVNAQWRSFDDLEFISQHASIAYHTGDLLIREHLMLVQRYLKEHPPADLTASALDARQQLLEQLWQYAIDMKYPQNQHKRKRTPIFIDEAQRYCAVGFLILASGHGTLAKEINATHHYGYLEAIAEAYPIQEWAEKYGFTLQELAWIQPSYDFRPEVVRQENMLTAGSGLSFQQISDPLFDDDRYNGTGWTTAIAFDRYYKNHRIRSSFSMAKASVDNAVNSIGNYQLQATLHYYRYAHLFQKVALFWGAGMSLNHGFRWNSDAAWDITSYDGTLSFDIAVRARRGFNIRNRNFALEYSLNLPAVSYIMRNDQWLDPAFTGLSGSSFDEIYQTGTWMSWGSFQRIQTGITMEYYIRGFNKLSLGYFVDTYRIGSEASLGATHHGLLFSVMTKF